MSCVLIFMYVEHVLMTKASTFSPKAQIIANYLIRLLTAALQRGKDGPQPDDSSGTCLPLTA